MAEDETGLVKTIPIPEDLYDELIEKLYSCCMEGWDQYTNIYIVDKGKYTHEQEMERGDSTAWRLMGRLKALQD